MPNETKLKKLITVAASDGNKDIAYFSNYGVNTVDAAPGVDIYSAAPGIQSMPMSGTSMAAPFVTRIAGMIKDTNSKLTPSQIKRILMETVDKKSFLTYKVRSGGIVSEERSLRAA